MTKFFYLILIFIFISTGILFLYKYKKTKKNRIIIKKDPIIDLKEPNSNTSTDRQPSYDPNIIVLQIKAFPCKPYIGYELLQTLESLDLYFGEMSIFHRHDGKAGKGNVLFSVASASTDGSFTISDMGAFKTAGLVMFMKLDSKQKLMVRFNLMLDVARQLTEELGGEIYDDINQPINAAVIRRLREKICTVETSNLYVSDLLDNLD